MLPKLADEQSRLVVSRDAKTLRDPRPVVEGFWMEQNLSAHAIHQACLKAIEAADLTAQDFKVDYL